MSRRSPPLDVDYSHYERLKTDGANADVACQAAVADGKDFLFLIRMLRSVFGLEFPHARDLAGATTHPPIVKANERLFSYGTLQLPEVQRATFGRLLDGAPDALVGFRQDMVEITDPDVLAKSGERFHPIVKYSGNTKDRVEGAVFAITPAELAAADAYEVSDYERVEAELASGLRAWVYVQRG